MSESVNLGKVEEGQIMDDQEEKKNLEIEPGEPDEGWWAAVLADEPQIEAQVDRVEPIITVHPSKTEPSESKTDKAASKVNWEKVKHLYGNDEIISLNVIGYNRGGILVAGTDIHGFVPSSHLIDLPADLSEDEKEHYLLSYLGRKISLKVIECERGKERVVFSERAALAKEGQRKHLLNSLCEGDCVSGIVTNVTNFGVFVDLGGLEGLIHVSELSWGRVQHPSEVLTVDDRVQTQVLQVSEDQGRIALSLKRLHDNPWKILAEKLSPGDIIPAEISCIVKYGAFARIDGGVEGLIHVSSMNFPEGCHKIDDFLYEGQSVMVCVLNVDPQKRRIGLKLESYQSE